jgi:two-component system, cell cycle response regulator DivK
MERRRPRNPPARPLVLVIDRDEDARALYALALSASGFDVVAVQDEAEAFNRAWEIHPDIIVADLPTPDSDGWQVLETLKQNPRTQDIPVVAVSDHPSPGERAAREGFAAFLSKPCWPDELADGLRQVLSGKTHATAGR